MCTCVTKKALDNAVEQLTIVTDLYIRSYNGKDKYQRCMLRLFTYRPPIPLTVFYSVLVFLRSHKNVISYSICLSLSMTLFDSPKFLGFSQVPEQQYLVTHRWSHTPRESSLGFSLLSTCIDKQIQIRVTCEVCVCTHMYLYVWQPYLPLTFTTIVHTPS